MNTEKTFSSSANRLLTVAAAGALSVLLAACSSSSGRHEAIMNGTLGERTNSICFNRDIRSWHEFGQGAVIVETRGGDYYKVDLAGGCNSRNAFLQIEVESRGGMCLEPGDRVTLDRDIGISCTITEIHRWHLADIADQGS